MNKTPITAKTLKSGWTVETYVDFICSTNFEILWINYLQEKGFLTDYEITHNNKCLWLLFHEVNRQ